MLRDISLLSDRAQARIAALIGRPQDADGAVARSCSDLTTRRRGGRCAPRRLEHLEVDLMQSPGARAVLIAAAVSALGAAGSGFQQKGIRVDPLERLLAWEKSVPASTRTELFHAFYYLGSARQGRGTVVYSDQLGCMDALTRKITISTCSGLPRRARQPLRGGPSRGEPSASYCLKA